MGVIILLQELIKPQGNVLWVQLLQAEDLCKIKQPKEGQNNFSIFI